MVNEHSITYGRILLVKFPEKSFSTATGHVTSLRRLFAPSLRPKLLLRPDGSGPIGQGGVQGQVVAITVQHASM